MPFHGQQFIQNQLGRPFPGAPQGSGAAGGMPDFMQQFMQMMGGMGAGGGFANTLGQPGTNVGDPGFGQTQFGQQGGTPPFMQMLAQIFGGQDGGGGGFFNTTGQPGTNVGDPGFGQTPFGQQGGQFGQGGTDPRTRFFSRMMRRRGSSGLTRAPSNRAFAPPPPEIRDETRVRGQRVGSPEHAASLNATRRARELQRSRFF